MATQPLELVEDRLYVLGDGIDVDGRVSWYPDDWRGSAPVNSLLLLEPDGAVLVDTGVTVHERTLVDQLRELLDGRPLSVAITRAVEFDGLCNVAALYRDIGVATVYSNQPPRHYVHWHPAFDEEPQDVDGPAWAQRLRVVEEPIPLGRADLSVGAAEAGRDRVEALPAPLRLLATHWMYDRATRVLFTSDSFGHEISTRPTGPAALDGAGSAPRERVRAHLHTKFEWMAHPRADVQPVREQLAELFAEREIETVVPGYGLTLRGSEAVRQALDTILAVLDADPVPA